MSVMINIEAKMRFYLNDTKALAELKEEAAIYMFLLETEENSKAFFPVYIGETSSLRSRFLTHITKIIAGEYWFIDTQYMKDYAAKVKLIQQYESFDAIQDNCSDFYESNYGSINKKFERMIDRNRIDKRFNYLNNVMVQVFHFNEDPSQDKDEQALRRKQIEGKLILYYNELLISRYGLEERKERHCGKADVPKVVTLNPKIARRNNTVLGAISVYPDDQIELNLIAVDDVLQGKKATKN